MKTIRLILATAATLFAFGDAMAVVYLKPIAADETRATQDGASWATAYADAATAIAAAQGAADSTLYAAAGVYTLTSTQLITRAINIYGGFSGADGESVDSRDLEANETIFTGDVNGDDTWTHYELNTSDGSLPETKLADKPVIVDGRFSPPPAYTGDYDIYAPDKSKISDNTTDLLVFMSPSTENVLDGLVFMGTKGTSGCLGRAVFVGKALTMTIRNCRFLACAPNSAVVHSENDGAQLVLENVRIAYGSSGGSTGVYVDGGLTAKACSFESLLSTVGQRAVIFAWSGRKTLEVNGLTFARIGKRGQYSANYGGPGVIFSCEAFSGTKTIRNCVVSNCYGVATTASASMIPLVSRNYSKWLFENCRFSKNYCGAYVQAGGQYVMIGSPNGVSSTLFNGCVFDDNVVRAYRANASSGSFALGVCGSPCKNNHEAFVNCVFDRNSVEVADALSGWTVTRSQGLLAGASSESTWTSAANCTFRSKGDAGVADVAVFGASLTKPVNLVNCLFMSDADVALPFAAPDGLTSANGICVWNSTAQNVTDAPGGVFANGGWLSDAVTFDTAANGVLTPAVKTPGIRETADVAVYELAEAFDVRFRPAGESTWLSLNRDAVEANDGTLIGDIADPSTPRPEGAFTRGAKQALTDAAETGKTLTLRRSPVRGGTLDGPSAQAVAAGAATKPVTAVAATGMTFGGWYQTDGSLYSSEATLSISSLADDLVLVAKFLAPSVTISFDLGHGGTFNANGASTIVVTKNAGDAFEIPAYTVAEGWYVEGFGATPEFVALTNESYAASVLTTASRVFRVVPSGAVPEGSDKSGSSWANATDDIDAAIRDAARYRGELWFKRGVYDIATSIDLRSNVGLYGGFAGTETARDQADAKANPTVFTGDMKRDDYWKGKTNNGWNGYTELGSPKVFDYETLTFSTHDPSEDGVVWFVISHCLGDNTAICLSADAAGTVTNSVISGLTFLSFGSSAIRVNTASANSSLTIEDCTFNACSFNVNNTAPLDSCGSVRVSRCQFVGNRSSVILQGTGAASVIADTSVRHNESHYGDTTTFRMRSTQPALVTNCAFVANQPVYAAAVLSVANASLFADCRFERNRLPGNDVFMFYCSGAAEFRRCQFVGNTNAHAVTLKDGDVCYAGIFKIEAGSGKTVVFRDSLFDQNTTAYTKNTGTLKCSSVATIRGGGALFVNCTLTDNEASASDASDIAATVIAGSSGSAKPGVAFVHCTLANRFAAGAPSAEIHQERHADGTDVALTVLNSVLYSADAAYRPIRQETATAPVVVASSHLSNTAADGSDQDLTRKNCLWRDVTSANPILASKPAKDDAGLRAWGVSGMSPLRSRGLKTYLAADGTLYFHDAETDAEKPWRKALNPAFFAASVEGLTDESPVIPDAFGQARNAAKIAAGPLLPSASSGFLLIVR